MKALSLTQPWATLVAVGAKRIETRSWSTSYRGVLAIHAAKGFPKTCRQLCGDHPFRQELDRAGVKFHSPPPQHWYHAPSYHYRDGLPLGAIVAVARLTAVQRTEDIIDLAISTPTAGGFLPHEIEFGDYAEGRYGWLLSNVVRLREPVPCKGALGVWTVPPDVERQLRAVEVA